MAKNDGGGSQLWLILKVVLMTAGAIYLVSLLLWLFQWATFFIYAALFAGAVGIAGYLAFRVAGLKREVKTLRDEEQGVVFTGLNTEMDDFDKRLLELEREERRLDAKIRA